MGTTSKWMAASLVALGATGAMTSLPAQAQHSIVVQVAPPPPRYEVAPAPRYGHVWVPGHWQWSGNGHVWVGGHFVASRPGYRYAQPAWVRHGDRWAYNRGGWSRGDRDRDGIPNRYDRDRDNDGVRNRNDRDRDGDGVPNRFDSRPNNPYRR
jgi:hypothetical protein